MDYVPTDRCAKMLMDVNVLKVAASSVSDHFVLEASMKVGGG